MDYNEFIEYVKCNIKEMLEEQVTLELIQVKKNNGVILDGMVILKKDQKIAPTIYLLSFYNQYQDGYPIVKIMEDICNIYYQSMNKNIVDVERLMQYSFVKEKICYRLINFKKNEEFLKTVPYVKFLDLAIIFFVCVDFDMQDGCGSFVINEDHLKMWEVDYAQLYKDALYNTPVLLKEKFCGMEEMLGLLLQMKEVDFPEKTQDIGMYVLSNEENYFGASVILYQDTLKRIAKKLDSDLYIIPSSINEVILIPEKEKFTSGDLREIVLEVNTYELSEMEILSDNIYLYEREKNEIIIMP